ncbi:MAG TPA: cell division protein ZipA C-terminal FtsZ-binding domain-containing protein, partial [Pseudomonadales bacterium]|nr:cell division protein ZipA C-terminal FtsZ-binding domain-containing protein [Pseudomonadales bacterium]
PGITMFLSMGSLHGNTMEVFDLMLETARAIASRLNGELRDDQRSVLTNQTIEHNRQRIRQFEMQSRMRAR